MAEKDDKMKRWHEELAYWRRIKLDDPSRRAEALRNIDMIIDEACNGIAGG